MMILDQIFAIELRPARNKIRRVCAVIYVIFSMTNARITHTLQPNNMAVRNNWRCGSWAIKQVSGRPPVTWLEDVTLIETHSSRWDHFYMFMYKFRRKKTDVFKSVQWFLEGIIYIPLIHHFLGDKKRLTFLFHMIRPDHFSYVTYINALTSAEYNPSIDVYNDRLFLQNSNQTAAAVTRWNAK